MRILLCIALTAAACAIPEKHFVEDAIDASVGAADDAGASCGNGIVDESEACDPGNAYETATCDHDCTPAVCGDGVRNTAAIEGTDPSTCLTATRAGTGCAEVCDDGNTNSGDDCSANCLSKETCGNGIVDVSRGEICDDGNVVDDDGCSNDCQHQPGCGNGLVDVGEDCDDGDTFDSGNGCSATCHKNSTCGDGAVEVLYEQCDRGVDNGLPGKCCDAACSFQAGHTSCP